MSKPDPLDSILGAPLRSASTISSLAGIAGSAAGVTVAVQRTDLASDKTMTELVRLDAQGNRRASVLLGDRDDEMEQALTDLLVRETDLRLLSADGARVRALTDEARSEADEVAGLGLSKIEQICCFDGGLCVRGRDARGAASLCVLPAAGTAQTLPLDSLALGGHRQLGEVNAIGNALFASVADPVAGLDVFRWAFDTLSEPPVRCLTRGAQRFALNAAVAGMMAHPKGLLMGTAALAGPRQPAGYWGPELLLMQADGTWDMLIGQPRFSLQGLILPASGLTAGMGEVRNAAIRAMHGDGVMTVIALQDHAGAPEDDRRKVSPDLSDYSGALRLFASFDLDDWTEIPHELSRGIGAVTSLFVTESALFVGHEAVGADAVPVSVVPLSA